MKRMMTLVLALALFAGMRGPLQAQEPTEGRSQPIERPQAAPAPDPLQSIMERRFLDGKISAKQYQRFLRRQKPPAVLPEITNTAPQIRVLEMPVPAGPPPRQTAPTFPYTNSPTEPVPTARGTNDGKATMGEVEILMMELLRLKAKREEESDSTSPQDIDPTRSKRDRLNALLRLFIQKKISEEEYNKWRAQVIAEPEGGGGGDP